MFQRAFPIVRQLSKTNHPVRGMFRGLLDPSREIRSVMRDMERRMQDFEREIFRCSPFLSTRMVPIDGLEAKNNKIRYALDLQGFKPEDIKISMKDNKLKIEAKVERTGEDGSKHMQQYMSEFTIPENMDVSAMQSTLHNNGTLIIEGAVKLDEGKKIPIGQGEEPPAALKSKI